MTLRLSDAIRIGAMLRPRGVCALLEAGRTCALGAALDAIGYYRPEQSYVGCLSSAEWRQLSARWPLLAMDVRSPADGHERQLSDTIIYLNDSHEWSRERIADWVESLERQSSSGEGSGSEKKQTELCANWQPEPVPQLAAAGTD